MCSGQLLIEFFGSESFIIDEQDKNFNEHKNIWGPELGFSTTTYEL